MRIISGAARGRRLVTLAGQHTRPTADRVKEAIFSSISAELPGAVVLDAFAGSAALGLEALSRGAEKAFFVEKNRAALQICEKNIRLCGFPGSRLLSGDVLKLLPQLKEKQPDLCFSLVFSDPPYAAGLSSPLLECLLRLSMVDAESLAVVETAAADPFSPPEGWEIKKTSTYGSTAVHYCRISGRKENG
ncbi:MAG: 16S rRNA (guanine(966)-N(2))-methyltransferase RsmD [Bacillota bacterium]|nr:16S rRNA (guanine(966)-N(2))-methyltransferase RsmD [Bacillota bacterium]